VKIHLIGICGTAMATLAALLKRGGQDVQGSDENVYPPMSAFLESERIRTFSGYDAARITEDIDVVVVGNAISRGNTELEAVLDRKLRYCSLPEAVRRVTATPATCIGMTGALGTLKPGALADVSLFRLAEGEWRFVDAAGQVEIGGARLEPVAVLRAGRRYDCASSEI